MMTTNDIEVLLKPKAAYHASPKVKERVMAEVAKTAAPISGNNHRWLRWAGIAASLLMVAGVGWMLLNKNAKVSEAIRPVSSPSVEDTKPDAPLVAQVTEPPKPQKRVRRQTVPHQTAVELSPVKARESSETTEEERATPVDVQEDDGLEAMLNAMQQPQSMMSEEEEYMHMNVKVFTANIRIRNRQEN